MEEVGKAQDHMQQFSGLQRLGRGEMATSFHSMEGKYIDTSAFACLA